MEEKENVLVVIPEEVKQLSQRVNLEKQEEVNNILNQLFAGTANWKEQINAIVVKDHTDTMAMSMASVARKNVKNARLEAEKLFDAKRDEVQRLKSEFDLEDKLWLKSKQVMQALFKAIEEEAEYKENTLKRYEIEQKEKRTQERLEKIIVFNPTTTRFEVENLSDEMFNTLLSGLEKEYNDRIEAEKKAEEERVERERIENLHSERKEKAIPLYNYWTSEEKQMNFGLLSDKEFDTFMKRLESSKAAYIKEQEEQRKENERLKAEAEAKQKEIEAANAKAEQERKAIELKAQKEREEAAEKLRKEQEIARIAAEKAACEKARLELQLRAQKEAEERAANEKRIAAEKAKKEAEKLAKAPIKEQLNAWVESFSIPQTQIDNETTKVIKEKFDAFKVWCTKQVADL